MLVTRRSVLTAMAAGMAGCSSTRATDSDAATTPTRTPTRTPTPTDTPTPTPTPGPVHIYTSGDAGIFEGEDTGYPVVYISREWTLVSPEEASTWESPLRYWSATCERWTVYEHVPEGYRLYGKPARCDEDKSKSVVDPDGETVAEFVIPWSRA